ncbi:hypothetical protein AAG612_04145 [Citromicrobium bathyomarinum]|uniref:hypothetical protein n=1 Tax=Citromicrobium bathyomarinum TaxID=72174 RepID=UPI003159BB76
MVSSPVSGVAGSVRIHQLTLAQLRKAERHGKRLDETGKARAVLDAPPLTTTGLNLEALYLAHIDGAFLPKARTKVLHVLVQFPSELVDGEDGPYMLKHARFFAESVFGSNAIIADRLDRDEKGRRNVDLFVVPKYIKKTKHTEKSAISVTRHLKLLADRYGRKQHKWDTGRALQDALHDYMDLIMGLEGVQRGNPKAVAGDDWKSAEELRAEEIARISADLDRQRSEIEEQRRNTQSLQDVAEADRSAANALRNSADAVREEAYRQESAAKQARAEAERIKLEAEAIRNRALDSEAKAETARHRKAQELEQREMKLATETAEVEKKSKNLSSDLETAQDNLLASQRALAGIAAKEEAIKSANNKRRAEQEVQDKQLALLARAADDDAGLELKLRGDRFEMNERMMTESERETYHQPWHEALIALARSLARMLKKLRDRARTLNLRETEFEKRKRVDEARDREERADIEAQRRQAREMLAKTIELQTTANVDLKDRQEGIHSNENEQKTWLFILKLTRDFPQMFDIASTGRISLTEEGRKQSEHRIIQTLAKEPPDWVKSTVKQQLTLAEETAAANAKRKDAEQLADRMAQLLKEAGPVLTPAQANLKERANQAMLAVAAQQENSGR